MKNKQEIVDNCIKLLNAFKNGDLGDTTMPEDTHPNFSNAETEAKYAYFTLPMSLNYQRDSFKLWESALKTYEDNETRAVFDINLRPSEETLRKFLLKYKLALQPNKHIHTWCTISNTIKDTWGSFGNLFDACEYDFLKLKQIVQKKYKKGFPYLSGPKIFNYWSFIIQQYGGISLRNSEFIEIAPDTHVIKASVSLGVIKQTEVNDLSREEISKRWRDLLKNSGITPIEMHSPLWFWSRSGFKYKLV